MPPADVQETTSMVAVHVRQRQGVGVGIALHTLAGPDQVPELPYDSEHVHGQRHAAVEDETGAQLSGWIVHWRRGRWRRLPLLARLEALDVGQVLQPA